MADVTCCLLASDMKSATTAEFQAQCAKTGRTAACCDSSDRGESFCEDA
jgi:hypothetical protein